MADEVYTGGCLCGGVRYRVTGHLRPVVDCHCGQCRRTHGHVAAYTAAARAGLELVEARELHWYGSSPGARRGFCATCGASVFWERIDGPEISIAAGAYSKRSLDLLSTLTKQEANDFTHFCSFVWMISGLTPVILNYNKTNIYGNINTDFLDHLDSIGLIKFIQFGSYSKVVGAEEIRTFYYGIPIDIELISKKHDGWHLEFGNAAFAKVGAELAPICGSKRSDEFLEFVIGSWHEMGNILSCPLPRG